MTNQIIQFIPKSELDARKNLEDFILFAESLEPLNNEMDYNTSYWKGVVNFTKLGASSKDRSEKNLLDSSILRFSKAYLLYSQTHNRTKVFNEMKAIRAIEQVMLEMSGHVDIIKINMIVLDKAASLITNSYSAQAAYQGGCHLEKLKKFLVNKKIIKPITWLNPIKRCEDTIEKVSAEGEALRYKKLPDENALLAIAEIFSYGVDRLSPKDIFVTSSVAILMAAPARASELFYLTKDCIHEGKDKDGNDAVGLKWYSGKGYGHEVEWIPDCMVEIVKEALKRLANLSNPAREFARQIEYKEIVVSLEEDMINFPYVDYKRGLNDRVKWSEALYSMFKYQLNTVRTSSSTSLWMPNINTLSEDLSTTKKLKKDGQKINAKSVFERHSFPSYSLKTHQLRHLLSTIAKVNGMRTELLTKWAGRANPKDNRVYNHILPEQYNDKLSLINGNRNSENALIPIIEVFKPSTIQEINTNASLTLHQTEFGVCLQSYISNPCTKHRNCITCSEQVCIKGDKVKLGRLEKRLNIEKSILEADERAIADGSIGADRHYNKRLETIKVCTELIAKLTDANLPDGTLIKISPERDMSNLDRAFEINNKKRLPKIEKTLLNNNKNLIKPQQQSQRILQILRGD